MLLVCNGAQKSGSTWLYNILTSLVSCQHPDAGYLTGNTNNPCIRPDRLADFLREVDIQASNYITKNHLSKREHRDMLLSEPDVYVFDIERDPRDVVVSLYYDARNRFGYEDSFENYYWSSGREQIAELASYHALWRSAGPRSHLTSYEGLKSDFSAEVKAVAGVLGLDLPDANIEGIQQETSIDSLRKKYSGQSLYEKDAFFRKGIVGDWKNHLTSQMQEDIGQIVAGGMSPWDLRHRVFQAKRWVGWQLGH